MKRWRNRIAAASFVLAAFVGGTAIAHFAIGSSTPVALPDPTPMALISESALSEQAESEPQLSNLEDKPAEQLTASDEPNGANETEPSAHTTYETTTEDGIAQEHQTQTVLVRIGETDIEDLLDGLSDLGLFDTSSLSEALDAAIGGWAALPLSNGVSVPEAIDALNSTQSVAHAQPNYVYHLADNATPESLIEGEPSNLPTITEGGNSYDTNEYYAFVNDPQANNQMLILTEHAREAYEYTHDENGNPTKWSASDARPAIAVLDTGCDIAHEDLAENVIDFYDAVERAKPARSDFSDIDYHGTHVCGIAAAGTNNNVGIVGISFDAKLVPVRVFKRINGSVLADSLDILAGYEYVLTHASEDNIRVVNLSLGSTTETADADDKALLDAIERASKANILTVISAGNDADIMNGAYSDFPCDFAPSAIGVIDCAVTGVQEDDEGPYDTLGLSLSLSRASYSNYNMAGTVNKQLSALGDDVLSTTPGNHYRRLNGTSMAAPCVSGVAALALSVNPSLNVNQLKSVLYSTAEDITPSERNTDPVTIGYDAYTGFGNVDANGVVRNAFSFIDGPSMLATGDSAHLSALTPNESGAYTWSSTAPNVVSVSDDGEIRALAAGDAIVFATSTTTGNTLATVISVEDPASHTAEEPLPPSVDPPSTTTQPMFRLYNPNSGEHFYTAVEQERDHLKGLGWRYEGIGWAAPLEGDDVYRLYNPNGGDHHYTISSKERDCLKRLGWTYEGIGWRSSTLETVAIYREYNPNARSGAHNYTSSLSEHSYLASIGWHDEGICWYGA